MQPQSDAAIDLYWLPLGAGGRSVRLNGKVFEAAAARLGRRDRCDLYHSALQVYVPEGRFVIEQAPAWGDGRPRRRRRGRRRSTRGPTLPPVPLRDSALAGRGHSGRRRGRREPSPPGRRSRLRASAARARARSADTRLGPRRAGRGRDVELELDDLLAARAQRARRRGNPAANRRTGSRLAGRHRHRAPPTSTTR